MRAAFFLHRPWLVFAVLAVLCLGFLLADDAMPRPAFSVAAQARGGEAQAVTLPYAADTPDSAVSYTVSFTLPALQSPVFLLRPSGCVRALRVNGRAVELSGFRHAELCHKNAGEAHAGMAAMPGEIDDGFALDLSRYVSEGENSMVLNIQNKDEPNGFDLRWGPGVYGALSSVFGTAALMLGLYLVARRAGLDKVVAAMLAAAALYFLYWLHYFPNTAKTNDIGGHLSYIDTVMRQWAQPFLFAGHENFHPPTYYYAGALAKAAFLIFAPYFDPLTGIRLLSLGFYLSFCLLGALTLRRATLERGALYYVGTALIVLWPASILYATRITNDVFFYPVWAAVFYCTERWWRQKDERFLPWAVGLLGLAFAVKSTAFVPLGMVGCCVAAALWLKRLPPAALLSRRMGAGYGCFAIGVLVNAGRIIYERLWHGRDVAGQAFGDQQQQALSLHHFATLDAYRFIAVPFNDYGSEASFWHIFFNTMLYGEFSWKHVGIAVALNALLLLLLAITLAGCAYGIYAKRERLVMWLPYLVGVAFPVGFDMAFYALRQMTVCQDFRYVVPMVVPLSVLYVEGGRACRVVYVAVGGLFTCAGCLLYLGEYLF